jgi:hypothetical protein
LPEFDIHSGAEQSWNVRTSHMHPAHRGYRSSEKEQTNLSKSDVQEKQSTRVALVELQGQCGRRIPLECSVAPKRTVILVQNDRA